MIKGLRNLGKKAVAKVVPRVLSKSKREAHKKFLGEKNNWTRILYKCLASTKTRSAIQPLVKDAVIKLNKLPFLYTMDSFGDRISSIDKISRDFSLTEARKEEIVRFIPAFISIHLDPTSRGSATFKRKLLKFGKQFPRAGINIFRNSIEIMSQGVGSPEIKTRSSELDRRFAESKTFMKAFEKFVDGLL